jgi:hypothetical protein
MNAVIRDKGSLSTTTKNTAIATAVVAALGVAANLAATSDARAAGKEK